MKYKPHGMGFIIRQRKGVVVEGGGRGLRGKSSRAPRSFSLADVLEKHGKKNKTTSDEPDR